MAGAHSGYRKVIPLPYFVALAAMAVIVLVNLLWKNPNTPDQFGLDGFYQMDHDWRTAEGKVFEISEIDTLRADGTGTVTIYHQLPAVIEQDESLVFRSKNSTVVVLNWHRTPRDHSLLWLAIFAMAAACWCLLETNVFQLFVQDLRLLQVMDNMMLVLAGLPLYLYLDSVFGVFRYRTVRILCALDIGYILLSTLSQFLGFWDYHQTLNGAVATYGVVVIVLIVSLVKRNHKADTFSAKSDRVFFAFQQIGILLLGLGLLGDLVRYLVIDVLDRAFIIRFGLLFFILCFGAGNIYQMIMLVKKGMETDFISQLAYLDGLTKVGNRTAYLEQLQHLTLAHADEELGLVMFDINNLKRINDTYGHKTGDELLLDCAGILRRAFAPTWNIYRIGGDEFTALAHGKEVMASYEEAVARFTQSLALANKAPGKVFQIAVAHGVAIYPTITQKTIDAAEKEADANMYKDKHQLKGAEKQNKGRRLPPALILHSLLRNYPRIAYNN